MPEVCEDLHLPLEPLGKFCLHLFVIGVLEHLLDGAELIAHLCVFGEIYICHSPLLDMPCNAIAPVQQGIKGMKEGFQGSPAVIAEICRRFICFLAEGTEFAHNFLRRETLTEQS